MDAEATSPGRHRRDDGKPPRPFSIRTRFLIGALLAITAGTTALVGPALAAGPVPPPDPEDSPVAREAHAAPAIAGTPCSVGTKACVDLEKQIAWITDGNKVVGGPVKISSGGEGKETPVGHSFRVYRKDIDHKSGESRLPNGEPAPMPFSTFFADGGIAFHAGDPARSSAGCIRMERPDAEATFNHLQMGDKVQVVNGSVEYNARHPKPKP